MLTRFMMVLPMFIIGAPHVAEYYWGPYFLVKIPGVFLLLFVAVAPGLYGIYRLKHEHGTKNKPCSSPHG